MFVNFSNHASLKWSLAQREAALKYGEIFDVPFPGVNPGADEERIGNLAEEYVNRIMVLHPDCVMCAGEFTLSYAVISRLLGMGVKVVAACSERVVQEKTDEDGSTHKEVIFKFVKFREFK